MLKFSFASALIGAACAATTEVIYPPAGVTGEEIALVWVVGAGYKPNDYTNIATAFQNEAAKQGYKAWVGIPDFYFTKTPSPVTINKHIDQAIKDITATGFDSDNWFLSGHSLGGVMTQGFLAPGSKDASAASFKGQILMSSALLRSTHSIQDDGTTLFDYSTPTLTLSGSKDGLMRVTRIAESYFHQEVNITDDQAGLFPVQVLEGVSHAQFADETPTSYVQAHDLAPDVTLDQAHTMAATAMAKFVNTTLNNKTFSDKTTDTFMTPFLTAMQLEGFAGMKPECDDSSDINTPSNVCLTGSPFVQKDAVQTMAGTFSNKRISISDDDEFHKTSDLFPYHHPILAGQCDADTKSNCEL